MWFLEKARKNKLYAPAKCFAIASELFAQGSTVRLGSDMAESSSSEVKDVSDDNTLTLVDFLEEELQLESDANAVLGPSDDKNCTYNRVRMIS